MRDIVFLFGAGASFGAGGVSPGKPALGDKLYRELAWRFADTWGAFATELGELFDTNFERGMGVVYDLVGVDGPRFAGLMCEMAAYFRQFRVVSGKCLYCRLTRFLNADSLMQRTVLSTLNYDCLVELAVLREGLVPYYPLGAAMQAPHLPQGGASCGAILLETSLEQDDLYPTLACGSPHPVDAVPVLKLHGSCNWVPWNPLQCTGGGNYNQGLQVQGPITCMLDGQEAGPGLGTTPLPPVMSIYAPAKPLQVCQQQITALQAEWTRAVLGARAVFCIGVRPNPEDRHIWGPLALTTAPIYCVGGRDDFCRWAEDAREGKASPFLAEYFRDAYPGLERELSAALTG